MPASGLSLVPVLVRVAVSVGLIAGVIVVPAAPASATPVWSITPSPSPVGPTNGLLSGVSCATATICFAVGNANSALVQRWNGNRWSLMASPKAGTGRDNALSGVACPTSTSCFAVGAYSTGSATRTLVEHWDGTSWSIMASPNGSGSTYDVLSSVSCVGPASCIAVGEGAGASSLATLVEHWDGTAWSIVASPNPTAALQSYLTAVRCPTTTKCVAVGYYTTASATKTLAERWDGTSWSILASPNPGGTTFTVLSGLACPGVTSCFAVGNYGSNSDRRTLIARWDGTSWSIVASPHPAAVQSHLTNARCLSTTSCYAVGAYGDNTLVERWDGTAWSFVPSPNARGAGTSELNAVACITATRCIAVGDSDVTTLVEQWNGTSWSISAPPLGGSQSGLAQVACSSTTSCFAVGSSFDGSVGESLVERWDGTRWSIVASPNPTGSVGAGLTGVACPSASSCFAVGIVSTASSASKTLVEHWNGTSWSIMASPNPSGSTGTELRGIACPSTTRCFAAGNYTTGSGGNTLVEQWNGASWSIVASPNPSGYPVFGSVACPSTTSCNAVGIYNTNSGSATLVEHWDGTSWSIVPSPNPSSDSGLSGVTCSSTTSCEAVGGYYTNPSARSTLVEHWDGTSWSVVPSPNPSGSAGLSGVACSSATNCDAVGAYSTGSVDDLFAEEWDGTTWSIVSMPNRNDATSGYASAVACPAASNCFAVGGYYTNAGSYTLIERSA